VKLVNATPRKPKPHTPRRGRRGEDRERVLTDIQPIDSLGERTPYACPDVAVRYGRSTTRGSRGSAATRAMRSARRPLLDGGTDKLEESLWVTLRMLEERRHPAAAHGERDRSNGASGISPVRRRTRPGNIKRLREMLLAPRAA